MLSSRPRLSRRPTGRRSPLPRGGAAFSEWTARISSGAESGAKVDGKLQARPAGPPELLPAMWVLS